MPSAVRIFLKKADEKQVIYFTWPYVYLFIMLFILYLTHQIKLWQRVNNRLETVLYRV